MSTLLSLRLRNLIVVLLACLGGGWSAAASAGGLTELLVGKLGVTQPQAVGGAGSIFQLAKKQMTAGNFAKLSGVVPGMSKYLAAAPATSTAATGSGTGAFAGAAAKALGGSSGLDGTSPLGGQAAVVGGKLATLQQLAPAFEQLGMKQKLIGKFVPVVVDYVQQQGGASMAQLLSGALGF